MSEKKGRIVDIISLDKLNIHAMNVCSVLSVRSKFSKPKDFENGFAKISRK
tara:strand:- start:3582 stop:3734 length:153 start_codon:yes stop_codon:yes gene_type:complete